MSRRKVLTIDRVNDLTIRATRPALLNLRVVDLEEVVKPGEELSARTHDEDASNNGRRGGNGSGWWTMRNKARARVCWDAFGTGVSKY